VADLVYMARFIYAEMLRKKKKVPFGDSQLSAKGGIFHQCHWARRYKASLMKEFPEVFHEKGSQESSLASAVAASAAASGAAASALPQQAPGAPEPTAANASKPVALAKGCILDPLMLYERLEGPARSMTLVNSLPHDALRMAVLHAQDIDRKKYAGEVSGAIAANVKK